MNQAFVIDDQNTMQDELSVYEDFTIEENSCNDGPSRKSERLQAYEIEKMTLRKRARKSYADMLRP